MLLYAFDNADTLKLVESRSTAKNPPDVRVGSADGKVATRIFWSRHGTDCENPTLALALPLRPISGKPDLFELEVCGMVGSCRLWLEAADAQGVGLVYDLGMVDTPRWRTLTASFAEPVERWTEQACDNPDGADHPIHIMLLGIAIPQATSALELFLRNLGVTGAIADGPSGIAC